MRDAVIVLAVYAVAGLACAWAWHAWWDPGSTGFVFEKRPYFGPDDEFRSTGMYVAIAAPVGALLGVVLAWVLDHDEVVTLLAAVLGAVLAGGLMMAVGHALGPETATAAAQHLADGADVRSDLRVQPGPAWLAFPLGSLIGTTVVLLAFNARD